MIDQPHNQTEHSPAQSSLGDAVHAVHGQAQIHSHQSRWYDPYPKLSFALQLLDLAPGQLQSQATMAMLEMLDGYYDEELIALVNSHQDTTQHGSSNRRGDHVTPRRKVDALLKDCPETIKNQAADLLLRHLA